MLAKLKLIWETVRHLRWVQVRYQLYYRLRSKLRTPQHYAHTKGFVESKPLKFIPYEYFSNSSHLTQGGNDTLVFSFLNLTQDFEADQVDWEFEGHGKLWNYNLNYFEFLFDSAVNSSLGMSLIRQYCKCLPTLRGGLEPYPISLRGINWIKFLSQNQILEEEVNKSIYMQYQVLLANLEFHIQANHLLENAFSLIFGAYYFRDERMYKVAARLLREELDEQILADGAHYERSPMYHQIILFRLLDFINLVKNNRWHDDDLEAYLLTKAGPMLSWLTKMTAANGDIPMVKDATEGIAPSTRFLTSYAQKLGLNALSVDLPLGPSGYRWMKKSRMEMMADVGAVGPSHQPGHAHADELNFLLYANGKPVIVDTGVSTYEKNERRQLERSTVSHNCVVVQGQNSSRVWGGFRVAKRAGVRLLEDQAASVAASHTGYKTLGMLVHRRFGVEGEDLVVETSFDQNINEPVASMLHFHPDIEVEVKGSIIKVNNLEMRLEGIDEVLQERYSFAKGFNRLVEAQRLVLKTSNNHKIIIRNVS